MIYKLVASSRSRATEVYQGEDGSLVEVYYMRSRASEARPVSSIDPSLTVRYRDGETWETDPIPAEGIRFPAQS